MKSIHRVFPARRITSSTPAHRKKPAKNMYNCAPNRADLITAVASKMMFYVSGTILTTGIEKPLAVCKSRFLTAKAGSE